jgi:Domain of unknown function (DUF6894)
MNYYYLHLRDFRGELIEDEEGSDFPSVSAARDRAITSLRELMGEAIKHGHDVEIEAVVVGDERGNHVTTVPLAAALPEVIVKALKNPLEVVPLNRLAEYRRQADECRAMAENAADPDDKVAWLKLADAGLHMLPTHPTNSADTPGWPKATDEDSKASH